MSRKTPKPPSSQNVKVVPGPARPPRVSAAESDAGERRLVFPGASARQRLVAGRVGGNPLSDVAAAGATDEQWPIKFPKPERVMSSPELIKQIERTLDRMQRKLDTFKEQMDESFKFPGAEGSSQDGDEWPPRAA